MKMFAIYVQQLMACNLHLQESSGCETFPSIIKPLCRKGRHVECTKKCTFGVLDAAFTCCTAECTAAQLTGKSIAHPWRRSAQGSPHTASFTTRPLGSGPRRTARGEPGGTHPGRCRPVDSSRAAWCRTCSWTSACTAAAAPVDAREGEVSGSGKEGV